MSEHHPEIHLYCRKPSWCVYSVEQRKCPDLSDEDNALVGLIQCIMATGGPAMNGVVYMPKSSADICLVEEYLTSSHCYLPFMCYCKLLENILTIITPRTIQPVARVKY